MDKKIRICKVCGNDYSYCPHCSYDTKEPSWKFLVDTENCYTIFQTLSNYSCKTISKDEAKKVLEKANLSNILDDISKQVDEVLDRKVAVKETAEENIIKEEIAESTKAKDSYKTVERQTVKQDYKKNYNSKR